MFLVLCKRSNVEQCTVNIGMSDIFVCVNILVSLKVELPVEMKVLNAMKLQQQQPKFPQFSFLLSFSEAFEAH